MTQDEIQKMLARLCTKSSPITGVGNRIRWAFDMGKEWEKLEEKKDHDA